MARPPPSEPDVDTGDEEMPPEPGAGKTLAQPSPFADAEDSKARRSAPPRRPTSARPATPSSPPRKAPPRRTADAPQVEADDDPAPEVEEGGATRIEPPPKRRPTRAEAPPDENATQAGPPIVLEIVHGPDQGEKVKVRGGRMIIGRGDGCDFKLNDGSASRRHAELAVGPTGAVLRDLGSGNGTQVNGEKITEVPVQHGDQIYIGQTVLQVVDELKRFEEMQAKKNRVSQPPRKAPPRVGPRPAPAEASAEPETSPEGAEEEPDEEPGGGTMRMAALRSDSASSAPKASGAGGAALEKFRALPPRIRLAILGGGGLIVLFLLLALVKPKPAPEPVQQGPNYSDLFEEGKRLLRQDKHEAALEKFQAAQQFKDTKEVQRAIETAQRDQKGKKFVEQAKRLALAGNFEQALETLSKVDDLSNSADTAKELAAKYEEGKQKALVDQIRKLAREGDAQGARELLAKLPPEKATDLEGELGELGRQADRDRANQAAAAASAAHRAQDARARAARAEVDNALANVYRKVDQGNFDGAVREIERVLDNGVSASVAAKCRLLKSKVPLFGQLYTDGVGKYNGGQFEPAASSLLRALTILREMDINSSLENGLKEKAARAVSVKGRNALSRQDYGTAAKAFRDSLQLNPGNAEATNGLADISRRATDVYMEGYTAMTTAPDIARKKFEMVMEMAPKDSKPYQDAARRLHELDAGH